MATKPGTTPALWANLLNYDSGPFIGSPMKVVPGLGVANSGHRPGAADPTAAEHENSQQNKITTWITSWLALGSSAGASDAHVVESDATGRTSLTGLNVTNTVTESGVISLTNGGTLPSFFGRNSVGPVFKAFALGANGPGFEAVMGGGTNTAFKSSISQNTKGLHLVGTSSTTYAIEVTADAASTGILCRLRNDSTDPFSDCMSVVAEAGAAIRAQSQDGFAIQAFGNGGQSVIYSQSNSTETAIEAQGGNGIGVDAVSDNDIAVKATSTNSNAVNATSTNSIAILATSNGSSAVRAVSTSGSGVNGVSTSGSGGTFTSTSGAGITATSASDFAGRFTGDQSSPTLGVLFLTGQDARPTSNSNGQISYLSTERQFGVSNLSDAAWRGVWSSTGGFSMARGTLATKLLNAGAGVWSDVLTITASNGNDIKVAFRQVLIRISCEVSSSIATNNILNLRVLDDSDGGTIIFTRSNATGYNQVYSVGGIPERSVCVSFLATPQATGTQIYRLQMGSNTAASNLTARDISMDYLGQM